jgi:nucleolar protein 15
MLAASNWILATEEAVPEKKKKAKAGPPKKSKNPKPDSKVPKKAPKQDEDKNEDAAVVRHEPEDVIDIDVDVADDDTQNLAAEIDPEEDNGQDSGLEPGQDMGKIPALSRKEQKKKAMALSERAKEVPGVVYVGHIPHGFYEHEMRQYFSQFGSVTRLRLSRNRKTGASKHFAFIEFAEESTAEIVAKTMDSYLMFGRILKCKVVPREKLHEKIWEGANRRFKKLPRTKMAASQLNRPMSQAGWEKRVAREKERRSARAKKLEELGYEFEAPKLLDVPPPVSVPQPVEEVNKGIAPA